MREHFGELVFGTTIPRNVRIAEAPSHGLPVLIYDNACAGSQAYILLASEFIRRRAQPATPSRNRDQPRDRMSQPPKPRGLGRGLSALLGDDDVAAAVAPPAAPSPAPAPPPRPRHLRARRSPCRSPSSGPAASSRARPSTTSRCWSSRCGSSACCNRSWCGRSPGRPTAYEIVAGERRWRAAQKAQLHEVPVVVRNMGDQDALQLGLIENLQRTDLTAIDEAQGYRRLVEDFAQSQDDIARTMGKSRSQVANTVRLLELPPPVQAMIQAGDLTAGQARALIGTPDPLAIAQRAVAEKLSARELERMGSALKPRAKGGRPRAASAKSADTSRVGKAHRGSAGPQGRSQAARAGRAEPAHARDPRLRPARHGRREADATVEVLPGG